MKPKFQLVRYDAMCRAIQTCHRVDEAKAIRDRAIALEAYAAQALDLDAEKKARRIRLRAKRRASQLLRDMGRNGQGRGRGGPGHPEHLPHFVSAWPQCANYSRQAGSWNAMRYPRAGR